MSYNTKDREISDACHQICIDNGIYKKLLKSTVIKIITPPNKEYLDIHEGIDCTIETDTGVITIQYRFRDHNKYSRFQDITMTPREWDVIRADYIIYGYYKNREKLTITQVVCVRLEDLKEYEQYTLNNTGRLKRNYDPVDKQVFYAFPMKAFLMKDKATIWRPQTIAQMKVAQQRWRSNREETGNQRAEDP